MSDEVVVGGPEPRRLKLDLKGGSHIYLNEDVAVVEAFLANLLARQNKIKCRTVLVLGGARSGKSRFALNLAETTAPERVMIATAEALDTEMAARITRHQEERGVGWGTRETPIDLVAALKEETRAGRAVLVDCVTLWLTNLMLAERDLEAATAELAALVPTLAGPAIFVSNEVGQGITPLGKMARDFQDAQGRANQALAGVCDAVVAVTAGLPRLLKPAPAFELRLDDCVGPPTPSP